MIVSNFLIICRQRLQNSMTSTSAPMIYWPISFDQSEADRLRQNLFYNNSLSWQSCRAYRWRCELKRKHTNKDDERERAPSMYENHYYQLLLPTSRVIIHIGIPIKATINSFWTVMSRYIIFHNWIIILRWSRFIFG